MKFNISEVLNIILLFFLLFIVICLLGLVVEFNDFKKDFHKAYFPDYNQANCLGCQPLTENSMMGNGYSDLTKVDDDFLNLSNSQWASQAVASSSYGSETGNSAWSPLMATGKPDVGFYGDNGKAWAPKNISGNIETLTATFSKAVYATGINIKESYGSGAIIKVEIGNDADLQVVWDGNDLTRGLNYFKINFEKTKYKVNTVKITFDTSKKSPNEWAEIDAVQLIGQ